MIELYLWSVVIPVPQWYAVEFYGENSTVAEIERDEDVVFVADNRFMCEKVIFRKELPV